MIKPRFEIFCSYCTTDYNELLSSFDTSRLYCSAHLLSDNDMIGSLEYFHKASKTENLPAMYEVFIVAPKSKHLSDIEQVDEIVKMLVMKLFYEYPLVFCISSCQGMYVVRLAISSFSPFISERLSDTYPDDQALEMAVRSQIISLLD